MIKKNKSTFVTMTVCFALLIITIFVIPAATSLFEKNILKDTESLILIPEYFSLRITGPVFILAIITLWIIVVNYKELKEKRMGRKSIIQNITRFRIGMAFFIAVFLFLTYLFTALAGNYLEIYKDRISSRNGFLFKNKIYTYNRVKGINIGYFIGRLAEHPVYELIMDDGSKLNIAADGIYPYLFYAIDKMLPDTVKRKCTDKGESHIIDKMPPEFLDYYISKYSL